MVRARFERMLATAALLAAGIFVAALWMRM
jgi:hypothetical protein